MQTQIIENGEEVFSLKIGCFGCYGKTAVTLRFLKGEFTEGYIPSIDEDFYKIITIDGQKVYMNILDTAGKDDFAEMRYSYFTQVQGYIFFFDITNYSSIDDLRSIYNDMRDAIDDEEPILIIGALNSESRDDPEMTDLVPVEEYSQISQEFNCEVLEVSAMTGMNVDSLFLKIGQKILNSGKAEKKHFNENIKGEWNIGLVKIYNSDPEKLARRYVYGDPHYYYNDDYIKIVEVDNEIIPLKLTIFKSDQHDQHFFSKVQGTIFVININSGKSEISELKEAFNKAKSEVKKDFICIIAVEGCELRECENKAFISYDEYDKIEKELGVKVIEVSSEKDENVDELFFNMTKKISQYKKKHRIKHEKRKKEKKQEKKKSFFGKIINK